MPTDVAARANDEELVAIEQRANAATPGPWFPSVTDTNIVVITAPPNFMWMSEGAVLLEQDERDMAFIAAAREDVPRLVADLRAERAARARLRAAAQEVCDTVGLANRSEFKAALDALMAALGETEGGRCH
jgi:hypothetical protein